MQLDAPIDRHPDWTPRRTHAGEGLAPGSAPRGHGAGGGVVETTLLDLVHAVSEEADDEDEVVATVIYMLTKGSVRLTGAFRGQDRVFAT